MKFNEYYFGEIQKYGGYKPYILGKAREKKPLLDKISKYAVNMKIIEAGSGSSSNSIYLANNGFEVTAVDKDREILSLAKKISKSFKGSPKFINKKFEEINESDFSVIFSHGVLEHFRDEEIVNLIDRQLKIGKYLIFSVPSDFFKPDQAIKGDERFMSVKKWESLISRSNGILIEKFSYFYDPDTTKLRFLKALFNITLGILPLKKPYIGFVIK